MGQLLRAVAENREPSNSAAHNVASLRLVLAARESADAGGSVVATPGLRLDPAGRPT